MPDRRAVLGLALIELWLLWWLPTIALGLAGLAWRHVWFDLRMARVRRLREAGRLDAARAELDRIQRDFGAAP